MVLPSSIASYAGICKQPQTAATIPPVYTNDLTRTIGALQHLQVLMATWNDPTLADVAHLVGSIQRDFGPGESLEKVIQTLVGQHLASQMACRRSSLEPKAVLV